MIKTLIMIDLTYKIKELHLECVSKNSNYKILIDG